jgi:hypothetical protein
MACPRQSSIDYFVHSKHFQFWWSPDSGGRSTTASAPTTDDDVTGSYDDGVDCEAFAWCSKTFFLKTAWNKSKGHKTAILNIHLLTSGQFFVANTFQIKPFYKGLAMQADVAFVLCQEHTTRSQKLARHQFFYTRQSNIVSRKNARWLQASTESCVLPIYSQCCLWYSIWTKVTQQT